MNTDRRPGSRLPDDPAYWERLAARSVDAALQSQGARALGSASHGSAAPAVGSASHGSVAPADASASHVTAAPPVASPAVASAVAAPWWRGLSDAAVMLAASALLALAGGFLLLGERSPVTADTHALTEAIAPDDDLLRRLMSADEPPPATAMLHLVARREAER